MSTPTPLPTYPRKPTGDDLTLLKQAKALVDTDKLIIPVDAVVGSPGRILALREKPDWICDYAYVQNPTIESVKAALEWILNDTEDGRGMTVIRKLTEIFGPGVKEIADNIN